MGSYSREDKLAVAMASPAAVAVHDKQAWLGLFTTDACVEDPVGSAAHSRKEARQQNRPDPLGPFYETFIAPNTINFDVTRDLVCRNEVMRDLVIQIQMSARVQVRVPVHLLYELEEEQGALKVARLAAHWELLPMLKQQLASGPGFLGVGTKSGVRMLRHLGLGGMMGFARAASSVGDAGKAGVANIVASFNKADSSVAAALAASPKAVVHFPVGTPAMSLADWLSRGGQLSLDKVMAAGSVVSATMTYEQEGALLKGVALFELDPDDLALTGLRCYFER